MKKAADFIAESRIEKTRKQAMDQLRRRMSTLVIHGQNSPVHNNLASIDKMIVRTKSIGENEDPKVSASVIQASNSSFDSIKDDNNPSPIFKRKNQVRSRTIAGSKNNDNTKSLLDLIENENKKSAIDIYSYYGISVQDMDIKLNPETREPLTQLEKMKLESDTIMMKELFSVITKSNQEKRYAKATRHLQDAIYLRKPRHDIDPDSDSKFLKMCYYVQTNQVWQMLLYFVSWIFMGLAIFEPNFTGQNEFFNQNERFFEILVSIESVCLFLFIAEVFMEIVHKRNDPHLTFNEKYIKNYKFFSKFAITLIFVLDTIIFYSSLPHVIFRFSRLVRPFALVLFQKQLRRTMTGIILSLREMIDVLLFFFLIILIYAVLGVRLIGNITDESSDPLLNTFDDFSTALNNIYLLLTRDNYPDVMLPSYHDSPFYLFYFIPFLLVAKLLLVPIPIAVMFEAFKTHRGKLVVKDRIKEREAVFACFVSLDFEYKSKIDWDTFIGLFRYMYKGKKIVESKVRELFDMLDEDQDHYLTLKEFFNIIETLESNKGVVISEVPENKVWNIIRNIINKVFRMDQIAHSRLFDYFMLLVVLFNTVLLIAYTFIDNQDTLDTLDEIDNILVYIYLAEVIIKIIGLGIFNYFSDGWNIFDFILTIVSLTTTIALSFSKFTRTAKASRVLRNLRAQRALKLLRVVRGFKLCKVCLASFHSFKRVNLLFQNIATCFPIFIKLGVILFMVTYSYAILGMEIFPPEIQHEEKSHYVHEKYADFDSIGGALLILFQIINEAKWADVELDYAERFESLGKAAAFFDSYHVLVNFIIISLLTGLILEVFTFMNQTQAEQQKLEELLEEINDMEVQMKIDINTEMNKNAGRTIQLNAVKEDPDEHSIEEDHKNIARSQTYDKKYPKPEPGMQGIKQKAILKNSNTTYTTSGLFSNLGQESRANTINNNAVYPGLEKKLKNSESIAEEGNTDRPLLAQNTEDNDDSNPFDQARNRGVCDNIYETPQLSNRFNGNSSIVQKHPNLENLHTDKFKVPIMNGDNIDVNNANFSRTESFDSQESNDEISEIDNTLSKEPEPEPDILKTKRRVQILETRRYSDFHGIEMKQHIIKKSKLKKKEDSNSDDPYPEIQDLEFYLSMERGFYIKKITICSSLSFERNQLSYLMEKDKEKNYKNKGLSLQEELYLKVAEDQDEEKFIESEKPKDEKMKIYQDSRDKILEKIEAKKKKLYNNAHTSDRLIRKALLRGADINSIEKYEDEQMRNTYGKWFENMRETKVSSMLKVFEIENNCTIRMMRLMKQNHVGCKDFVEVITLIEESINKNLLVKGSLGKFVFKDSLDRWFYLYKKEDKIKIGYLEYGFWSHFKDVFPQTNQLYEAQDIFHYGTAHRYSSVVKNMFISTRRIAKGIQHSKFRDFKRADNVWNAYMIPFDTDNAKTLRSNVIKSAQNMAEANIPNIAKLLVTQGVFMSVNFVSKSNTQSSSSRSNSFRNPKGADILGPLSSIMSKQKSEADLKEHVVKQDRRRANSMDLDVGLDSFRKRRSERIDSKVLHGQTKNMDDVEEIMKTSDLLEILPSAEYVDFLRDMRDIMNCHKEYFLNKLNLFYLTHPSNRKIQDLEKN